MVTPATPRGLPVAYPDHVRMHLEAAIMEGRLAGGERIREVDLAEELGLSRTPVREALRVLERDGLVVRQRDRGTYVAPPLSPDEVDTLYSMRLALEPFLAARAAQRIDAASLDRITHALREYRRVAEEAAEGNENFASMMVNSASDFHLTIYGQSGSALSTIVDGYWARSLRTLMRNMWAELRERSFVVSPFGRGRILETADRLERVVEALRDRDPEGAALGIRAQLEAAVSAHRVEWGSHADSERAAPDTRNDFWFLNANPQRGLPAAFPDHVRMLIEAEILAGRLKDGDRIREVEVAERLGLSRTPVREALRTLERDGLVLRSRGRGTFVAPPLDGEETLTLYALRLALEPFLAARAAERIDRHALEAVERAQATYSEIAEEITGGSELNHEQFIRLIVSNDYKFHLAIYSHAGSALNTVLDSYWARALRTLSVNLWTRMREGSFLTSDRRNRLVLSAESHDRIVEALRARDPEATAQRVREHIEFGLDGHRLAGGLKERAAARSAAS